jgi:hypothetical protein
MKHITTQLLEQVEKDLSPSTLHNRMKEHLRELCRPCKLAFRDHQQRKLSEQPKKWVLEPLHKRTPPRTVAEQIRVLRALPPEHRLNWAETPSPELREEQTALLVALLLEARHAPDTAAATSWPEVAAQFLRANPAPGPEAVPLRILITTYQAEGKRRLGDPLRAARLIHEASQLARAHAVEDQVTLAELHFVAGKIHFADRQRLAQAEDHFSRAALLYAALGDDAQRAHCLAFQAVAMRRLDGFGKRHPPFFAPVELLLESIGILSPDRHAQFFLPVLLALAHLYCDDGQFHLAEDLRALLGTLAPQTAGPVVRARHHWLQARLAQAQGETEKATERYRACSVTVTEPLLDTLGLLLALRDQAPEP